MSPVAQLGQTIDPTAVSRTARLVVIEVFGLLHPFELLPRDGARLAAQVHDPRVGLVTITGCDITPDYAHAKVYFTVLGSDPEACAEGLNNAAGMLRNILFRRLTIHTVPTLHFTIDESVERGFAMDALIREAMKTTPPEGER